MGEKVILPDEVKVCCTCTYWDGERRVDEDSRMVVVEPDCEGECLLQEAQKEGLRDMRAESDCAWAPIHEAEEHPSPVSEPGTDESSGRGG